MAAVGGQVIQQSHSMPSGVDHTGLPSSTPEHKKSARNVINVKIQMLDNSISVFQIQHKALGRVLFDQVCKMISLLESDYFGLEYKDQNKTKYWLDYEKQMNRQIGLTLIDPVLRFCVKFFTPDPAQLEEPYTRYLFALQIKHDMAEGFLQCNDNTSALMASYIIQAECGDYMEEDYPDHSYLSSTKFVPHQDADMERRIMENYRKHKGQTPEVADLNLLEIARRCELYGIKMSKAKDHEGVPLSLAVVHMGILVFQNFTKINTFSWAKIRKLSFKKKRFLIKLQPEGYGYYKDTVEFYFEGRNECKNFWKKCIEHHSFFRCPVVRKIPRQKTRVFSRGSSFRYSGKTQKEVVDYVRSNFIKRQPFQRSASFKITRTSGRDAHPTMGRSISTHLPISESEQSFAQQHNAASTPVSQSCGSVTLTDKSGDDLSPTKELPPDTPTFSSRQKKFDGPPPGSVHVLPNFKKPLSYCDRYENSYENIDNTYHIPPPEGFSPEVPSKHSHSNVSEPFIQIIDRTVREAGKSSQKSPKLPRNEESKSYFGAGHTSPPPYRSLQLSPSKGKTPAVPIRNESHTISQGSNTLSPSLLRKMEANGSEKKQPLPPQRSDSNTITNKQDGGLSSALAHAAIATKLKKSTQSLPLGEAESSAKNIPRPSPQTVSVSVNTDPLDFGAADLGLLSTPERSPKPCTSHAFDVPEAVATAAHSKPKDQQLLNKHKGAEQLLQDTTENESEDNGYGQIYHQRVVDVSRKVQVAASSLMHENIRLPEGLEIDEPSYTGINPITASNIIAQVMKSDAENQQVLQEKGMAVQSPRKELRPKSSPKITTITIVKRKFELSKNVNRSLASPPPVRASSPTASEVSASSTVKSTTHDPSIADVLPQNVTSKMMLQETKTEDVQRSMNETSKVIGDRQSAADRKSSDLPTKTDGELQYVLKKRFIASHVVVLPNEEVKAKEPSQGLPVPAQINEQTKPTPNGRVRSKIPPPKPPRDVQRSCSDAHRVTIQFTDPEKKSGCIFKAEKLPLCDDAKIVVINSPDAADDDKGSHQEINAPEFSVISLTKEEKGESFPPIVDKYESSVGDVINWDCKSKHGSNMGSLEKDKKNVSGTKRRVGSFDEKECSNKPTQAMKSSRSREGSFEDKGCSKKPTDLSLNIDRKPSSRKESPSRFSNAATKSGVELVYISGGGKESDSSCEVILLPPSVKPAKVKPVPPPKPKKKPAVPQKPLIHPKPLHLAKKPKPKMKELCLANTTSSRADVTDNSEEDSSVSESKAQKSPKTVKSPVLYSRWRPLVAPDKKSSEETILWSSPRSPKSGRSFDVVPLSLLPSTDSYSFIDDTISAKSPDSELLEKLMGTHAHMQVPPIPPFPRRKEPTITEENTPTEEKLPPPPPPHRVDYNPNIYIGHTFRALSRISEGSQSEQSHSDSSPPKEQSECSSNRSSGHSDQRGSCCSSDASGAMHQMLLHEQIYENVNVMDDNASDSSYIDQYYLDINSDEREELEKQGHMFSCNISDGGGSTISSIDDDTLCEDDLNRSLDDTVIECDDNAMGRERPEHGGDGEPSAASTSQQSISHDHPTHYTSVHLRISPTGAIIEDDRKAMNLSS